MGTIVSRLKMYVDYKKITPSAAEKSIGLSNGSLSKPFKANTTIKTDTLEKFLNFYIDINPHWLISGKGNMLKEEDTTKETDLCPDTQNYQSYLEEKIKTQEKNIELLEENKLLQQRVIAHLDEQINALKEQNETQKRR